MGWDQTVSQEILHIPASSVHRVSAHTKSFQERTIYSEDNRYRYTVDRTNNGDTQLTVLYDEQSNRKSSANKKIARKIAWIFCPKCSLPIGNWQTRFQENESCCCQFKFCGLSSPKNNFVVSTEWKRGHTGKSNK